MSYDHPFPVGTVLVDPDNRSHAKFICGVEEMTGGNYRYTVYAPHFASSQPTTQTSLDLDYMVENPDDYTVPILEVAYRPGADA